MDHEGVKPHTVISEIIEDLAQAEGRMRSARDKMNFPFVADAPDYASIRRRYASQACDLGHLWRQSGGLARHPVGVPILSAATPSIFIPHYKTE